MLSVAYRGMRSGLHCLCWDERGMLCTVQQQRWARAHLPEQWPHHLSEGQACCGLGSISQPAAHAHGRAKREDLFYSFGLASAFVQPHFITCRGSRLG